MCLSPAVPSISGPKNKARLGHLTASSHVRYDFFFSSSWWGGSSLIAQLVKNPPALQEIWVENFPPEKGKATHSSILA